MARKGNPISVRLDLNRSSDSSRFSEGDRESHRRGQSFPSPHIKKGGEGRCRCPGRTRLLLTLEDHWKTPGTRACRYQAEKAGQPLPYVPIASAARAPAPSFAGEASPDLRRMKAGPSGSSGPTTRSKTKEEYRDYVVKLQSTNPNTTVKIAVERNTDPSLPTRVFHKIYAKYWQLGLDSNNGIYPLVYTLVEAESKSSWCWFLQCLGDDIDLVSFQPLKLCPQGIIPASFKNCVPNCRTQILLATLHEIMKRGMVVFRSVDKEKKDDICFVRGLVHVGKKDNGILSGIPFLLAIVSVERRLEEQINGRVETESQNKVRSSYLSTQHNSLPPIALVFGRQDRRPKEEGKKGRE
ncbi:hypothetical protein Tco_0268064 [Tanacetum coccineum]